MDATADYTAIRRVLTNTNLPAYVSYVVRSHAGFDAIHGDDTATIVVRTRDGRIVSGKVPRIKINADNQYENEVVNNGPFKPACYEAAGASVTSFESHRVEVIALRLLCHQKTGSERGNDTGFTTLYADPATHRPIAVFGESDEQFVTARLMERFTVAGGFVLPADFTVKIAGSGPMFWLNVDAHQSYRDYRFLSHVPSAAHGRS